MRNDKGVAMLIMTDPKKRKGAGGRPKGPKPPRKVLASFKSSEEYAAWFSGLIEHLQKKYERELPAEINASVTIDMGLRLLAEKEGYGKETPRR